MKSPKKNKKFSKVASKSGTSTRDAVETAIALAKKRTRSSAWGASSGAVAGRFTRWGESVEESTCKK